MWRPILEGSIAAEAAAVVDAITADFRRLTPDAISSKAALALYFGYLARARGDAAYDELASVWLDAALADAGAFPIGPGLYGGVAGMAWALEHLSGLQSPPGTETVADEDPNGDADELLIGYVGKQPWHGDYDLINGLVGIGVYFLERLPRESARAGLEEIVRRLGELAQEAQPGLRWLTPPALLPASQRSLAPQGYYNLGLAHGVPGIIALLSHCVARGVAVPAARRLLSGATRWLLAQQIDDLDSRFTSWLLPEGDKPHASRLAWCYGDLGIAVAVFSAGFGAGDAAWSQAGIDIAAACARRPPATALVRDACLCHGAAGLAHIFNRFLQATGDSRFRAAAHHWFRFAIDARSGKGYGGYQTYKPTRVDGTVKTQPWEDDAGLLEGSAGIGLALLASITEVSPEWDRMLLTSMPLRPEV